MQLIKHDMTILSVQKNNIFLKSDEDKQKRRIQKRLNQKLKYNKMKGKLLSETNSQAIQSDDTSTNTELVIREKEDEGRQERL